MTLFSRSLLNYIIITSVQVRINNYLTMYVILSQRGVDILVYNRYKYSKR